MAEDDSEWVVESIVGYLGSPEWVVPVTDFMENKCTVFDDEDENKLSYTEIHQQYKTMVENLLGNYMQEVGINEQQFLDACTSPFAQSVFQTVLATDDFQIFHSMMVQKNMELQLEALRVIKERNGALPECLTDGMDVMTELQDQEMKILQEVLKKSKEEYDEEMSRRELLDEDVGSASSSCSDKPTAENREAQITSTAPRQLSNAGKVRHLFSVIYSIPINCGSNGVESRVLSAVRAPVKSRERLPTNSEAPCQRAERHLMNASGLMFFAEPLSFPSQELTMCQQEQLQQRAAYLRQQRDKLQALKREQQRSKQGTPPEETPATPAAPPGEEISAEERKKLQKRKHLADKLKEEVINK
uniref:Cilia- and flagella-associated protein 36 n=1 Tax=Gasterosteus aculeatus aculeatus TaxID=481459 RepID=G3P9P6_GASAC